MRPIQHFSIVITMLFAQVLVASVVMANIFGAAGYDLLMHISEFTYNPAGSFSTEAAITTLSLCSLWVLLSALWKVFLAVFPY